MRARLALEGCSDRRLEHVDVDPDGLVGKAQDPGLQPQCVLTDSRARRMHRLVQVVRGGVGVLVRPQDLEHLVAMQPVAGRQREQLDQIGRLGQAPGRRLDGPTVGLDFETAKQPNSHVRLCWAGHGAAAYSERTHPRLGR